MEKEIIFRCMNCHEIIGKNNLGIPINWGDFWQCEDCHKIEYGVWPWPGLLSDGEKEKKVMMARSSVG